jgi:hypothetical protein
VRVLGRYVLFGRKLLGIRLCSCQDWSLQRIEMVSPSVILQSYYRENRIPFALNEVMVGHFYLQFFNCRVALLF